MLGIRCCDQFGTSGKREGRAIYETLINHLSSHGFADATEAVYKAMTQRFEVFRTWA